MINLKPYQLAKNEFPIFKGAASEQIKYKFPETAEEENDDILPLSGSANIELKFQGAGSLYLLKNPIGEGNVKYNFWSSQRSKVISFSEGRTSLDVLLWNGIPFEPQENHFEYKSGKIVLDESLNNLISALSKGNPEEFSPQKVIFQFTPGDLASGNTAPFTSEISLGPGNRDKLFINLQGLSGGGLELLTKIEMQIDERMHLINKGGGDYFKWRKDAIPFEAKLRETAASLLGKNNELLTQYRRIFDQNDQRRVRQDIQNFLVKLIEEFAEKHGLQVDRDQDGQKIIDIFVEEKPTGEISAGAGIGTSGGSFMIMVTENNWLGEGKNVSFDVDVSEESLRGSLNYTDPNYDFLGNTLNYSLSSIKNDKPDQGYENTLYGAGIGTTFEQYKKIFAKLGLNATFDDLRTQDSASDSLKKQAGDFTELSGNYGFSYDQRDRAFMPTSGSIIGFDQSIPIYADKAFLGNTIFASAYKTLSEDVVGASKLYITTCLLYTSPSPRDGLLSRMPSSA